MAKVRTAVEAEFTAKQAKAAKQKTALAKGIKAA
jgi:hypothetical protein